MKIISFLNEAQTQERLTGNVIELPLDPLFFNKKFFDAKPVWNIIKDVRSNGPNDFQVPRPSTAGVSSDKNESKGNLKAYLNAFLSAVLSFSFCCKLRYTGLWTSSQLSAFFTAS